MKKITLLMMVFLATMALNAQIVYNTVLTEDFEATTKDFTIGVVPFKTGGFPATFSVQKQTIWSTLNATLNINPTTGTLWKDLYSNNSTAANKTYSAVAVAENRLGGTGSQCIKFNLTGVAFGSFATPFTVRARSNDGLFSFNTAAFEGTSKYEVTFWARTDGVNKDAIVNTQETVNSVVVRSYLTITSTWQKFTLSRYVTGITSTALAIDFFPLADNSDFVVYMDDFTVKERKIAYTATASNITANSFTANWVAVTGANSYNLIVEKSDGGTTPVWTPITGSPFAVGNVTTFNVPNLDAATYRYRVTATDGTITTVESNNTFATVAVSGLLNPTDVFRVRQTDNNIEITSEAGLKVVLYNQLGQLIGKHTTAATTLIPVSQKGILIISVDGYTQKLLVK